jgi:hypothetical protein
MQLIRELCSIEGRGPGTDAERRAANLLAGRLKGMGRRVEVEPTFVHPNYALVHALHVALAIAGSLLATVEPAVGFALVLVAATSMYLDLNTRAYLARSLFFRRASQNVVSPGSRPEAPMRLILTAHYDAGRTGYVFGERGRRLAERLSERGRVLLGPFRILFWGGLAPLLVILGARMAGFDPGWLDVVQLVPTVLLLIGAFLLVDIALSDTAPGAYDNASGVAAVLSAADALDRDPPPNLDVWVVLTGSGESGSEGMRSFVRSHRKVLDRERTAIVNVYPVSYGTVHYQLSEGAVISYPTDAELVEMCEALGSADDRFGARPLRHSLLSDAGPAAIRGLRAISIVGLDAGLPPPWFHSHEDVPERVDESALDRATEYVVGLAGLLDRGAGRGASAPPPPAPPPEPRPTEPRASEPGSPSPW